MDRPISKFGVLIYLVNENWQARAGQGESDEGQVRVVDAHPHSYTNPVNDLYDAPFNIGKGENATLINQTKDLSIIVLAKIHHSYRIMLADADAGNRASAANNIIGQAEQAIDDAQAQSRFNGLDEAKAQLSKAISTYAEAQFADAIQAAGSAVTLATAATRTLTTMTSTRETVASTQTAREIALFEILQNPMMLALIIVPIAAAIAILLLRDLRATAKRRS